MSSDESLESRLATLSPIQREAVEWVDGPLLLLAGPGSGKTRVLTLRIEKLLSSSTKRRFKILALTFTTRAAGEMRDRLIAHLPGVEERLFAGTYHAFCVELLRKHGSHIGLRPDFAIYSQEEDRRAVLRSAARSGELGRAWNAAFPDVKPMPLIDRLRARLVLPGDTKKNIQNQELGEILGVLYRAYDLELTKANALDFPALLTKTYELMHAVPEVATQVREVYRYWCIDEFQDTNEAQYAIAGTLAGKDFQNLFVVADEDQIIYQWNGASYQRLVDLRRDFSPRELQLPTNFRCPAMIVGIANGLIAHNTLRTQDKLPALASEALGDGILEFIEADDELAEAELVAQRVAKLSSEGVSSICVLARIRSLLDPIQAALAESGISSRILQRRDEFASAQYRLMHALLRLSGSRGDELALTRVFGPLIECTKTSVEPADVIARASATNGDLLKALIEEGEFKNPNDSARSALLVAKEHLVDSNSYREFALKFQEWIVSKTADETPATGASLIDEDRVAWTELMRDIGNAIGRSAPIDRFVQEMDLRSKEPKPKDGAVLLMTIHGAKGNEFDWVFLVGMSEGLLPSFQSIRAGDSSAEMEEERRSCFVAITRAKSGLVFSRPKKYKGWTKELSRFLREMGIDLI